MSWQLRNSPNSKSFANGKLFFNFSYILTILRWQSWDLVRHKHDDDPGMYISLQCNVNFVISRLLQKLCLFWKGSPQITYSDSENGCWRGKSIGYVHNHRGRPSFLYSALFFLPKKNDTLSNKTVPKESFNPHTACLEGNTHKISPTSTPAAV